MADPKRKNALDELEALVKEREAGASYWQDLLPTLRAQASASSAVLTELVQHQTGPRSRRPIVDAILAAPDEAWADRVIGQLKAALPELLVDRGPSPQGLTSAPPPVGYTIRVGLELPAASQEAAREQVLAALARIEDADVDYSDPLDLIVISPRG